MSARGFTLLETMVVVAILGILAALAVPAFTPAIALTNVDGTARSVAAFLGRARLEAMANRRCTRVSIEQEVNRATLVLWRANIYDCGDSAGALPGGTARINGDGTTAHWLETARLVVDSPRVRVSFTDSGTPLAPPATNPHPQESAPFDVAEIRYRSTGWLYVDATDGNLYNDDGAIVISHDALDPLQKQYVIAESHGPICVLGIGAPLPGAANAWSCP